MRRRRARRPGAQRCFETYSSIHSVRRACAAASGFSYGWPHTESGDDSPHRLRRVFDLIRARPAPGARRNPRIVPRSGGGAVRRGAARP